MSFNTEEEKKNLKEFLQMKFKKPILKILRI